MEAAISQRPRNDEAGFPLPRGCYYGPLYTDAPQFGGATPASYREYFIEFDPKHALRDTR